MDACFGESVRVLQEILNLAIAVRTLISRVASEHDQRYWPFRDRVGEPHGSAFRRRECKIGCFFTDCGRLRENRQEEAEKARQREALFVADSLALLVSGDAVETLMPE